MYCCITGSGGRHTAVWTRCSWSHDGKARGDSTVRPSTCSCCSWSSDTHEDGTAKLANDRQQPTVINPTKTMVCRTHDTIRHGQTRSPLFVRTRLMSVKLKTHSYTTCNTLYTYMCRYVQIQPIPRANMFQVVLNIRTPSGNVIYCINSTYISRRVGTYTWYILEICLP